MNIAVFDDGKFLLGECKKDVQSKDEGCGGNCKKCKYWKSHNKFVEDENYIPKRYK